MNELQKTIKGQVAGSKPDKTPAASREQDEKAALLRILQLEADIRRVNSPRELAFHLANESRAVLGFRQAFVFRKRNGWKLQAVSSVSNFDRHAAVNVEMARLAAGWRAARTPTGLSPRALPTRPATKPCPSTFFNTLSGCR